MTEEASGAAMKGRCLCGAVSVTLEQASEDIEVCHCNMCRRWSGGPGFWLHGLPDSGFTVEGMEHVTSYRSSEWAERAFCSKCGSNLWYALLPAGTRSLMSGLFDQSEGFTIAEQIFVDERPAWAELKSMSHEKTGADVIAEAEAAGFHFD